MESIPAGLLPWRYPGKLLAELGRNLLNVFTLNCSWALRCRARAASVVLANTPAMQGAFTRLGLRSQLMPAIGLDTTAAPWRGAAPAEGPLRLLFVGNLIAWKGVDLALAALAQSGTNAHFTIIGDGPMRAPLERSVKQFGLAERVKFEGRRPRDEVLNGYTNYHALLFPSLHDTGGFAVIEAMAGGRPVFCLVAGGPALAVQSGGGVCVPMGTRASVVAGLAAAIRAYDRDRALLAQHGQEARRRVEEYYDWSGQAQRMDAVYHQALTAHKGSQP